MVVLKKMPGLAVISGFKGVVDFYFWKGIPVARRWPHSPGHRRAPAVEARWPAFATASKLWNDLTPEIQEAYKAMSAGLRMSGRDIFIKSYLTAYYLKLE